MQVVMLIFKLFGGSVNVGIPGAGGNIFAYSGPRGLKVGRGSPYAIHALCAACICGCGLAVPSRRERI